MSTTLMPPEQSASIDRSLRILPIAANLLPVEVIAARRSREVRKIVLAALAVVVLILILWYAVVRIQTSLAQSDLTSAQDSATAIQTQQKKYAEVVSAQAESQTINTQLTGLMRSDLQWSKLITDIQAAAPPGVRLTSLAGTLDQAVLAAAGSTTEGSATGAAAGAGTGVQGATPANPAGKAIGTITLTGAGPTKESVATYVDALAHFTSAGNPLLASATAIAGGVQFTIRLDINPAALGGRYSAKTSKAGK